MADAQTVEIARVLATTKTGRNLADGKRRLLVQNGNTTGADPHTREKTAKRAGIEIAPTTTKTNYQDQGP